MTALEELQGFATTLEAFCQAHNLKFLCVRAEADQLLAVGMELKPYLYLSQVSEQLVSGHVIPLSDGRNLFILVRTPFAASATLRFVKVRTYSLIIAQTRGMAINRFERNLLPLAPQKDLWELLTQASETVVQSIAASQAFVQPVESAPFPTKKAELEAYRATFCTGTVVGTVLAPVPGGAEADVPSSSVELYFL
jgi:hypothetical protein